MPQAGRLIRWCVALAAVVVAAVPASAMAARERPLVYVVVLDGLDGDTVEAGGAPFISSLLAGQDANATYFPGSSSVIPAETNPNHTAMMSGAYPGRSGIPANAFALYAPLENEDSCARTGPFDFGVLPTETSGESRTCPQAAMVFEAIGRQGNPDHLATAGIFGKPKLGRIFAGQNLDPDRPDVDYLWAPCASGPEDDAYCESVPTNPISGYAIDDKTVMDRVIASLDGGVGFPHGKTRPDFTFVNLHQIDSAGHATGTGPVYDTAIGQADDEVERLVTTLRARGEWERTVLILVSDHSMDTTSSKVSLTEALTGAGVAETEFVALNNEGSIDFVYLADRNSPDRFELLKRMREIIIAQPGVAEVFYREPNPEDGGKAHTLPRTHRAWRSLGERSGDIFVTAEPGVGFGEPSASSNPLPGNHGAPQTADNFLAVTGGGDLVRQGTPSGPKRSANPVNADIAPTVMGLFGLFAPDDSRGKFLRKAFDFAQLRSAARPYPPALRIRRGALVIVPEGGSYEIEARLDGVWERIAKARERARIKVAALGAGADAARVRVRSAAGIAGGWERIGLD